MFAASHEIQHVMGVGAGTVEGTDDAAIGDDENTVAILAQHLEVLVDHQNALASRGGGAKIVVHQLLSGRIETHRGVNGDNGVSVMAQLTRDHQLLQIAAGETARRKIELRWMNLQIGDASAQTLEARAGGCWRASERRQFAHIAHEQIIGHRERCSDRVITRGVRNITETWEDAVAKTA